MTSDGTIICNMTWTAWSKWSRCPYLCTGRPNTTRTRTCTGGRYPLGSTQLDSDHSIGFVILVSVGFGNQCKGADEERRLCFPECEPHDVDGGWSPWSLFSNCITDCEGGFKVRHLLVDCTNL